MWDKLREPKNILQREFSAEEPNLVWLSDCTQFTLFHKTYYLCAIMDVFSRKIIAYKISSKASMQLVTATFKIAYASRNPDNRLLFHSDRGCQYTSYSFRTLLIANGITQSFSRSGNPYDNGAMESFFSSFKQEEVYRTSYRSVEDCKVHIAEYMEFYNSKRHIMQTTTKHLIRQRSFTIKEKRTAMSKQHGSKVDVIFKFTCRFLNFCKNGVQ